MVRAARLVPNLRLLRFLREPQVQNMEEARVRSEKEFLEDLLCWTAIANQGMIDPESWLKGITERLVDRLAELSGKPIQKQESKPVVMEGKPLSEMLKEDRG